MEIKMNKKILFLIIFFVIIIVPTSIWGLLLFSVEKGAESSWTIGVVLFGSLVGGLCTLIAFIISNDQTKKIQRENTSMTNKQFKLIILNDKIKEYKDLKKELLDIQSDISSVVFLKDSVEMYEELSKCNIKKKLIVLKCNFLVLDDEKILNFILKQIDTLEETIDSMVSSCYVGEIIHEVEMNSVEKIRENLQRILSIIVTIQESIDIYISQAYHEKYNLIDKKP